jgi:glutathione S-transferase
MKLFYAPQSPFARKVRAAAIELGLDERIDLEYAEVVPGRPNTDYAQSRNPLRRIPALVTDAGETIFDSTVIREYPDDLSRRDFIMLATGASAA